ncbi:MAG: hypothetical protein RI885_2469 [Actinomycetota bacterium]|jgi:hypothetical protein
MPELRTRTKKSALVLGAAAVTVGAVVVALLVFQPWRLFVDVVADESIPSASTPEVAASSSPSASTSPSVSPSADAPASSVDERTGSFISHEHATSGGVRIVALPDGSRVLAIDGLTTTDGPDVHVWLSSTDVVEGRDGWSTAGTGEHLDLGILRGNIGDLVYEIPSDVDLSRFASVSLWCEQFGVSFGAAQLSA